MILRETVGMANAIVSGYDRGKNIREAIAIGSIQKNRLSGVSPTGYIINSASELNPQWPEYKDIPSFLNAL